ncbi:MAG: ABC-three component system protein [Pseudomonadota bacterium]
MNLQDAYYEQKFENKFLRAKGDEFQTFFERLMGLAYKADFLACRPWGKWGDRKNDGFLKSARCLFQVYAPNEMEAGKAKAKIAEDFEGAKKYWKSYFDKWVFVHNAADGLPSHVLLLLLDFEKTNPGLQLEPWGLEELRNIFRTLSVEDKESWFGIAPTDETKAKIGFKDLQVALEKIAALPIPITTEVKDIPMGKIEANSLSESVSRLLKEGMIKSQLIVDFFNRWHDETLGERLAEAFKAEYQRLREHYPPNLVFAELQSWAGGDRRGTPEHEIAVITILAYYFERCEIFEAARGDTP